jgi:hypothetical protein
MPRPSLISQIHERKYELRRLSSDTEEFVRIQREYERLVAQACETYACSKVELLRTLAPDFGKWVRDERLPWIEDQELRA